MPTMSPLRDVTLPRSSRSAVRWGWSRARSAERLAGRSGGHGGTGTPEPKLHVTVAPLARDRRRRDVRAVGPERVRDRFAVVLLRVVVAVERLRRSAAHDERAARRVPGAVRAPCPTASSRRCPSSPGRARRSGRRRRAVVGAALGFDVVAEPPFAVVVVAPFLVVVVAPGSVESVVLDESSDSVVVVRLDALVDLSSLLPPPQAPATSARAARTTRTVVRRMPVACQRKREEVARLVAECVNVTF